MRSLTAFVITAALVLCTASGAVAQAQPDLSGTWTFDPTSLPADAGGPGGISPPRQLTLAQDAERLTISFLQNGATTTMTYELDGSESRNEDGVSTATWQDDRLVIVTSQSFGGRKVEQRRVLSLDGDDLVLELPGPMPRQGGEPTVVRLVYRKNG
jgi:hypothetical protein